MAGSQHQFRCNYLTKIGRFQWKSIFVNLRDNRKEAFDSFTGREFPKQGIYMRNLTSFFASSDVSASKLIIFGKGKYSGHMQINGEKKKRLESRI